MEIVIMIKPILIMGYAATALYKNHQGETDKAIFFMMVVIAIMLE